MSLSSVTRHGSRRLALLNRPACRAYSNTSPYLAEGTTQAQAPAPSKTADSNASTTNATEDKGERPTTTGGLPFEQHPFQCFQEARKILAADREQKLRQIEAQKQRIAEKEAETTESGEAAQSKKNSLMFMRRHLQLLKVQADINDPVIKKRFEDGNGDMDKPIYRHLAERKWRSYDRKIIMQRLETMKVIPDVFPGLDPRMKVSLLFRNRTVPPGEFVPSVISTVLPSLQVQVYDKGPRYITVVVVDPDVPDLKTDAFSDRCHFMATNIVVEPNNPKVDLSKLSAEQVIFDWLPPTAQKGAPYHRLCTFIFEQPGRLDPMARSATTETQEEVMGGVLDTAKVKAMLPAGREHSARAIAAKLGLHPAGAHMFRSIWDDWTAGVMARHNLPGADLELVRRHPGKLPPKKRETGRYRGFAKLG